MKRGAVLRTLIAAMGLALSAIPMLCLLGIRDVGTLGGVESRMMRPSWRLSNMFSRQYVTEMETWYGKSFFLRKWACKVRYQLYAWMNFGQFYARGPLRTISMLSDGALISKEYQMPYLRGRKVNAEALVPTVKQIRRLYEILSRNGIDMMFVFAPDKAQLYPAEEPWFVRALWRWHDIQPQQQFSELFSRYGIPHFDAYQYLQEKTEDHSETMFPYAGIHWNALASSLTLEAVVSRLKAESPHGIDYRMKTFIGVRSVENAQFNDDDLGELLNLTVNPFLERNIRYVPVYGEASSMSTEGSALVFGDSFTAQLYYSTLRSCLFDPKKVVMCDKRPLLDVELAKIIPDLRLVLFVYQPPHMFDLGQLFGSQIKSLADSFEKCYCQQGGLVQFRDFSFGEKILPAFVRGGLWPYEKWGRWSSGTVRMSFSLPKHCNTGRMQIGVTLSSCTGSKRMTVFAGEAKVAEWTVIGPAKEYRTQVLPFKPGEMINLRFEQDKYISISEYNNRSADNRKVGAGFISMRLMSEL